MSNLFFSVLFSGYDGCLILQWLYKNARRPPNCIYNGAKILCIDVPDVEVRFIDSLSFIPAPLASFPKMFGLNELKKGEYYATC